MKKLINLLPLLLIIGCTQNMSIQEGDFVSLDYTGTLSDGSVFDTSVGRQPLNFNAGVGQMIPGFDQAILGMSVGEEKTFTLSPDQAYGEVNQDLIQEVSLQEIADSIGVTPEVGMILQTASGYSATITSITEDIVTLDFNHRLAGESLTFTVTILDVQKGA